MKRYREAHRESRMNDIIERRGESWENRKKWGDNRMADGGAGQDTI